MSVHIRIQICVGASVGASAAFVHCVCSFTCTYAIICFSLFTLLIMVRCMLILCEHEVPFLLQCLQLFSHGQCWLKRFLVQTLMTKS